MQEQYIQENKIKEKTYEQKEIELIRNIIEVKKELKNANNNFEYVEGELADYYTYQIKANQAKLNYLIKQAKIKGITIDMIKQIKISLYNEELDAG